MVDLSKLELKAKSTKSKAPKEPLTEDNDLVKAMQAIHDAERRISYRAFAVLAFACDETPGPKFTPKLFGILNRMPNRLDAIVVKSNGDQPNSDHADHPAQTEGWSVIDSSDELKAVIG